MMPKHDRITIIKPELQKFKIQINEDLTPKANFWSDFDFHNPSTVISTKSLNKCRKWAQFFMFRLYWQHTKSVRRNREHTLALTILISAIIRYINVPKKMFWLRLINNFINLTMRIPLAKNQFNCQHTQSIKLLIDFFKQGEHPWKFKTYHSWSAGPNLE